MGCKQSDLRGQNRQRDPENPDLPSVPAVSWYGQPFGELSSMPVTEFHKEMKGATVFSKTLIPTAANADRGSMGSMFVLGEPLYGIGYLHDTALRIEHTWRLRVKHGVPKQFERPFYDTCLGIRIFIDDNFVHDAAPFADSLIQGSATLKAAEAVTLWKVCPLILYPDPLCPVFHNSCLFVGMAMSFLSAASKLTVGEHRVRVEVVYGCKSEINFCTDFISKGSFTLLVTEEGKNKAAAMVSALVPRQGDGPGIIPRDPAAFTPYCPHCRNKLVYTCTVCAAAVCGSAACVTLRVDGYPVSCRSHRAMI